MSDVNSVLVTGCQGFIGNALVDWLRTVGVQVAGVDRVRERKNENFFTADITDVDSLVPLLKALKPDLIYHVAGITWSTDPSLYFHAHVATTRSLLQAVSQITPGSRTVIVGSAAEYGSSPRDSAPIPEETPSRPISDYARSKAEQSLLAAELAKEFAIDVVRVRLFNTLGKGQSTRLVGGAMVQRLSNVLKTSQRDFQVFDPHSERDFLDVRDIARLLWLVGLRCESNHHPFPINIGSGRAMSVQKLAELLMQAADLTSRIRLVPVQGEGSPTRVVANVDHLQSILANELLQSIPVSTSISDMWRHHTQIEEGVS